MSNKIATRVYALIQQCEAYADEQKGDRDKALRYYQGETPDLKAEPNMSSVVSRDVRALIRKVMPTIMRIILSNDRIGEYEPVSPETEEQAEQATDYINHIVVPESDATRALYDAIFDAVLLKTGILKWTAQERSRVVVSRHTGQDDEALLGLDEIGEVLDLTRGEDGALSFSLRRRETRVDVRLDAVPRGAFLIHPNATSIEDSPLTGERLSLTRSELVSRGYDRDTVADLKSYDEPRDPDSAERRGVDDSDVDADVSREMERVQVWDCYAHLDLDGDGIAEIHHVVMAEGSQDGDTAHVILQMEPAPEVPYAEIVVERDAHQFEGHSVAEDLMDVQRIKTHLLRQTLDNLVWQNNPQPYVQPSAVEDLEAVFVPMPRRPVLLKNGRTAEEAVSWRPVPMVADKSFSMLGYFDGEAKERTGITDASGGVDPDALQNMTATASALINEAGVAQSEMMLRSLTKGIKRAFEGLLRLVVAHADRPRTVRLRGQWHEYDPRSWDAEMQFTVNIGLGAGSRERDLVMLQTILGLQQAIITQAGANNPLVKPDQLYNTLAKIAESAGFPSADPYFTKPDPAEVAALAQQAESQPSEAEQKAQAQMQIEQAKTAARVEVENAQMQADLQVKRAEIEAERIRAQMKLEHDSQIQGLKAELDLLKHRDQMQLEWARLGQRSQQAQQDAFQPGSVIDAQ